MQVRFKYKNNDLVHSDTISRVVENLDPSNGIIGIPMKIFNSDIIPPGFQVVAESTIQFKLQSGFRLVPVAHLLGSDRDRIDQEVTIQSVSDDEFDWKYIQIHLTNITDNRCSYLMSTTYYLQCQIQQVVSIYLDKE